MYEFWTASGFKVAELLIYDLNDPRAQTVTPQVYTHHIAMQESGSVCRL